MNKPATSSDHKPTMDEGSFQQLLQAAYVLQQHNERSQSGKPEYGYAKTLAGVLEIQEQVRNDKLDPQATASLIARQLREFTQATGTAVGVLDSGGTQLDYYAASGSAAGEAGAQVPFASSMAAECLRTGLVLKCPKAESDPRLSRELCRQLAVKALIAVPVLSQGRTAGVVELHFGQPESVAESDVRTCQLLAAILAETLTQDSQHSAPSPAPSLPEAESSRNGQDPRATMLAALEKIRPHLERLAAQAGSAEPPAAPAAPTSPAPSTNVAVPAATCETCGRELAENEMFCGSCGVARRAPNPWASLWEIQRSADKGVPGVSSAHSAIADDVRDSFDVLPSEVEDIVARLSTESPAETRSRHSQNSEIEAEPIPHEPKDSLLDWATPPHSESLLRPVRELPSFGVGSATPVFPQEDSLDDTSQPPVLADELDQSFVAKPTERLPAPTGIDGLVDLWRTYRANIYVGFSALLLIAALLGFFTPSPRTTAGAGRGQKHAPQQPELSFVDRVLVNLGLAEAPSPPPDLGNPNTQVWVDVHTALYYCPGSDLYGKTQDGKFTTQQDAQQEAFQPAARRPCD